MPTKDRYLVCVSTHKLFNELDNASAYQLSLSRLIQEVSFMMEQFEGLKGWIRNHGIQRVFPKYTINGNSQPDGSVSQTILKSRLRSNLTALRPAIKRKVEEAFTLEFAGELLEDGENLSLVFGYASVLLDSRFRMDACSGKTYNQ